jgi:hypothetical protein
MANAMAEDHAEPVAGQIGEVRPGDIHAQLDRMLDNPHFSHSRRFPSFLRFVVEQTLAGEADQLKERTIGIEVFAKDPGYDTASDPIVRVTAAEIRKRIAQYYQEPGHRSELQISLPPGSYVPQFQWMRDGVKPAQVLEQEPPFSPAFEPAAIPENRQDPSRAATPRKPWRVAAAVALLAIVAASVWLYMSSRQSALDHFWAPVLASGEPVAVCFPLNHFNGITLRDAADPARETLLKEDANALVVDDLQPLVSIAGLLDLHHQRYQLIGADTATLTDLRRGPAIFIGAYDNAWTLRMTRGLRYRFGNDAGMTQFWIEDTQSPTHTRWGLDRGIQQATNNYRDYAIVARFLDANTGKLAVISAGIARGGTVAAGEFLTAPNNIELIKSRAPKNWDGQNMEIVLSTEIIDGRSSPPRIEAAYFW